MYVSVILSQDTYSQSSYLRKFKCSVKLKLFYAYFTIIQISNLFVAIQTLTRLNQTEKSIIWHRVSSARQIKLVLKTMDNLNTQRQMKHIWLHYLVDGKMLAVVFRTTLSFTKPRMHSLFTGISRAN